MTTREAITRTYFEDPELDEFIRFLCTVRKGGAPGTARVQVTERKGNPGNPREAGMRAVTLNIEWKE